MRIALLSNSLLLLLGLLLGVSEVVLALVDEDTSKAGSSSSTDESSSKERARIGERCNRFGGKRCQEGLECKFNHCYNRDCLKRETKALGHQFDPVAYKDSLLEEAGITKYDLFDARKKYNDTGFLHSAPANAFVRVILKHRDELERFATVLQFCASEESLVQQQPNNNRRRDLEAQEESKPEEEQDESHLVGNSVGSYFGRDLGFLPGQDKQQREQQQSEQEELLAEERELQIFRPKPSSSPTISNMPSISSRPSMTPSVSKAPSSTPSSSPTRDFSSRPTASLTAKTYIGFHLEGGALIDGSYSYMYPSDTSGDCALNPDAYQRSCIGFSGGFGGEVSLITLFMTNRQNTALLGDQLLFDFDGAVGLAIGNGFGRYLSGSATSDDPCYYEITVGGGFGIEVFGTSFCETSRPL